MWLWMSNSMACQEGVGIGNPLVQCGHSLGKELDVEPCPPFVLHNNVAFDLHHGRLVRL